MQAVAGTAGAAVSAAQEVVGGPSGQAGAKAKTAVSAEEEVVAGTDFDEVVEEVPWGECSVERVWAARLPAVDAPLWAFAFGAREAPPLPPSITLPTPPPPLPSLCTLMGGGPRPPWDYGGPLWDGLVASDAPVHRPLATMPPSQTSPPTNAVFPSPLPALLPEISAGTFTTTAATADQSRESGAVAIPQSSCTVSKAMAVGRSNDPVVTPGSPAPQAVAPGVTDLAARLRALGWRRRRVQRKVGMHAEMASRTTPITADP